MPFIEENVIQCYTEKSIAEKRSLDMYGVLCSRFFLIQDTDFALLVVLAGVPSARILHHSSRATFSEVSKNLRCKIKL